MKRKASPALIGAFVVGGLVLLALALIVVAGGRFFSQRARVVMHFENSVYGLEVGAPVVFRGVRVGTVTGIYVTYDPKSGNFTIPVVAELQRRAVRGVSDLGDDPEDVVQSLVQRGLSAQLSLQSLVTGQLYVDLDLRPGRVRTQGLPTYKDASEIPTAPTVIENLKSQLEEIDLKRIGQDLSALVNSVREVLKSTDVRKAFDDVQAITRNVRELTDRLGRRIDPLADSGTRAMDRVAAAADDLRATARSFTGASQRVQALLAPDAPLIRDLQATAAQLAQTAASLQRSTSEDGGLLRDTERAMQDLSRASRQLRDLAETLENNPESLLRGRPKTDKD